MQVRQSNNPPTALVRSNSSSRFYSEAIEQYKKLCLKSYSGHNNSILNLLKQENLNLYLDNYSSKEISILNKIIGENFYFKQILLAPSDLNSKNNKIKLNIKN